MLTCQEVYRSEGSQVRKVLKLTGLTGQKLSCQEIDGQEVNRLIPTVKGLISQKVCKFGGLLVKKLTDRDIDRSGRVHRSRGWLVRKLTGSWK
jgi:hypothetical protein